MRHPAINKGKAPVADCCCIALRLPDEAGAVEPSTVEQLKLHCLAFVFGKQPSIEPNRSESYLPVCCEAAGSTFRFQNVLLAKTGSCTAGCHGHLQVLTSFTSDRRDLLEVRRSEAKLQTTVAELSSKLKVRASCSLGGH